MGKLAETFDRLRTIARRRRGGPKYSAGRRPCRAIGARLHNLERLEPRMMLSIGVVDHFEWSTISSPQYIDTPWLATLTARDAEGNTVADFDESVALSGWTGDIVEPTVVITESGLDTLDYVEIQNVSGQAVDTSGWVVAISDSYEDINVVDDQFWSLPSTMSPGEVLYRTDDAQDNYWEGNIYWRPANPGWAILIDDTGQVVDYVAWGWTAADIAGMSATINGHDVTIGEEFSGDGVVLEGAESIQRHGNEDHDTAGDFAWTAPATKGVENAGLTLPFVGGPKPVSLAPAVTTPLVNGVWIGEITVFEDAPDVRLRAGDDSGSGFDSNAFDVLPFLGAVSGHTFNDLDGDAFWDPGEPALQGWQIYVDLNENGRWEAEEPSDFTADDGSYRIDVAPGTYVVAEVAQDDWLQQFPRDDGTHAVVVDLGRTTDGINFGNRELLVEILGSKFADLDGDGTWDANEDGLQGWKIYVDLSENGRWDEGEPFDVTGPSGDYSLTGLTPGTYMVSEVPRDGWEQTYPLIVAPGAPAAATPMESAVEVSTTGSATPSYLTSEGAQPLDGGNAQSAATAAASLIGLDRFRADPRFAGIDGSGLAAVIIDTGITANHPFFGADLDNDDVADRIVYQWDFAGDDANASDVKGHGSNVASIVASEDATYPGIAPAVDIIALRVFDDANSASFSNIEKALQWVVANAAAYHIVSVNMSLGDEGNHGAAVSLHGLGDELAALAQQNVIVVSAAGNDFFPNDSVPGVLYPAADPNSLAVGAVFDSDIGDYTFSSGAIAHSSGPDRIAPYSQRHETLTTVFAPGGPITGAGTTSAAKKTLQGTSQATPHVTGIAVLAQQLAQREWGRRLTPTEFSSLLTDTGVVINDGDDEDDNVSNTGLDFSRVDLLALAEEIVLRGVRSRSHTITLTAGAVVRDVDFGNHPLPAEIHGQTFNDRNGNAARDTGEEGLNGWLIYLDLNDNGQWEEPAEPSQRTDAEGRFSFTDLSAGTYIVAAQPREGWTHTLPAAGTRALTLEPGEIVTDADFGNRENTRVEGRHVFYNNSSFDGNFSGPNADDDHAIAVDKIALRPGQAATFANYTSYSRGINGVIVDVADPIRTPAAVDFEFRVGNDENPGSWPVLDETYSSIAVRPGAGAGGSDRVTIVFADYSIRGLWLQVTVKGAGLGMTRDDVFYFGNAIGEAGNSTGNARVTATDLLLARNNPRNRLSPPAVDFPYDFNRDGQVNATDVLLARNHQTNFLGALKLIDLSVLHVAAEGEDAREIVSPVHPDTGEDAAEVVAASVFDAVFERQSDDLGVRSRELAWLYEFEQFRAGHRRTLQESSGRKVVEAVLATLLP